MRVAFFVLILLAGCGSMATEPNSEVEVLSGELNEVRFTCEFRVHTGASQKTELVADVGVLSASYQPAAVTDVTQGMLDGEAMDIGGYRAELNIWRSTTDDGELMTDVTTILYVPDALENHGERAIGWSENSADVDRWRTAAIDWTGRFIKVEDADGQCKNAEDLVAAGQVVTLTCQRT